MQEAKLNGRLSGNPEIAGYPHGAENPAPRIFTTLSPFHKPYLKRHQIRRGPSVRASKPCRRTTCRVSQSQKVLPPLLKIPIGESQSGFFLRWVPSFHRGSPEMVIRAWRSHTHGIQNSLRIPCRDTEKYAVGAFRLSSPLLPITKRGRADSE